MCHSRKSVFRVLGIYNFGSRFEEFFNQKSVSRKKRAILHDPTVPIQMTKIDPVCGLRIDNENEEGQRTQPRFVFHVHLVGQNLEREI